MDRLKVSSRTGEILGVVIAAIVFLFPYENQLRGVKFFTNGFAPTEQLVFYGPKFNGMVMSLTRAILGRRNAVWPSDSPNALFLAFSASWLLIVFPFEFPHFADMFPAAIQFIFGRLTNDIGRFLFSLAFISIANCLWTATLYLAVRGQLLRLRQQAT